MSEHNRPHYAAKRRLPIGDLSGSFSDKNSFYKYMKEQLYVLNLLCLILFS